MPRRPLLRHRFGVACAAALFAAASSAAFAADVSLKDDVVYDEQFQPQIDLGLSIGQMHGVAHEFVFDPANGRKVSELIWNMEGISLLRGTVGGQVSPWWRFDVMGATSIAVGEGEMDDYDWLDPNNSDWTDWSHHTTNDVEHAHQLDASSSLSLFRHPNFSFDLKGGVRWDQTVFQAWGGHYIYSTDPTDPAGFRDDEGNFDSTKPGITYKQNFFTPYLGLGLNVYLGPVQVNASASGSWWVSANSEDQHHFRYLMFRDESNEGTMKNFNVNASYAISENLSVTGGYEFLSYYAPSASTSMSAVDGSAEALIARFPDGSAGMDSESHSFSVGLKYKLD